MVRNLFKGPAYKKKGDFAYSFDGLIIGIDKGVYQKTGNYRRFIIHWGAVNKSGQTKMLALSPANSYVLAEEQTTRPITGTGLTKCSQNHYQRTGCKDYTTIWPGPSLVFITFASGHVESETIALRARCRVF